MTGTQDAFARFRADVEAAVTRGRRAAAEGGARAAALRGGNRELAERARGGRVPAERHAATSADLQRVAAGFRAARGLPVERLPAAEELLAPPAESQEQTRANANPVAPLGSRPPAGPKGQLPLNSDDDEDFSQARILY
ncbi:hypothetical protein [Saccharothrix coeruleofusca]|uniref:Uncharacterized protein n=1 Tax=Saccharothrix coeruleofusca TaxID=33919 RepID=A0A918ALU7_9PSEU|nr:hypothetical protein [Saccharothrix coeruleofusca]MBP2339355.1 hypothetical protein [Saccharothrix coeruleofusca]GGP58306.1 hypothetical protein GCM10010185_33450 [Saccharothrix coeruleofusca]